MTWRRITGFRLVSQRPALLFPFYAALGFTIGERRAIGQDEMTLLGLGGAGERTPMRRGAATVDVDVYEVAGRPYPAGVDADAAAFQHFALPTADIDGAWRRAASAGAMPISDDGPVLLPPSSGGVAAVKFRDPEGHPLEFVGLPKRVDAGVDHSAVVAIDLDASLAFYGARGLAVEGRTLNRGAEQDALDGVAGAHVDVVPLYPAARSPHLELLHYRTPGARGPMSAISDVAATRVVWQADGAGLERDPDGHLHQSHP